MDQNRAIQQGDEVEYTPVLSKDKVCACVCVCVRACMVTLAECQPSSEAAVYVVGSYAKPNGFFFFHSVVHTYVRMYNRNDCSIL